MHDLVDFVLLRLAEDELAAERAAVRSETADPLTERWSGAWRVRDCRVKRDIVLGCHAIRVMAIPQVDAATQGAAGVAEAVLALLALPYAEHPGYRDSWRP